MEWEGLQKNYEIINGDITLGSLPEGLKKIEISRDDKYSIKGKITGNFEKTTELDTFEQDRLQRKFIKSYNYNIIDNNFEINYKINGFFNGVSRYFFDSKTFESHMQLNSVLREFKNSSKVNWLTDWFLNGPRNLVYTGQISHTLNRKYKRIMDKPQYSTINSNHNLNNDSHDLSNAFELKGWSYNGYIFVEFKDEEENEKCFTIQSVPDEFNPEWSKNVGIEYKSDWWIPDKKERKKIAEIVGFLLGRKLINIGYTKFDKNGRLIEDFAVHPITPVLNIVKACEDVDKPPIETRKHKSTIERNIANYFRRLIPKYLILREKYDLNEVLWKYWLSQSLPKEVQIIVIAACLELLFNAWYSKSGIKAEYFHEDEFNALLKKEIEDIGTKLSEKFSKNPEFKKQILKTINNSYYMNFQDKIHLFFEDIKLNIGDIENKAMSYRNKPAHGKDFKEKDVAKLVEMNEAYLTLINRIILKVLGYEMDYIDYYLPNYPEKNINEAIGIQKPVH